MTDRKTIRERLNARLVLDEATGCLLWTGSLSHNGYGRITIGGKVRRVHRVAWELENGPVPDGLTLDHVRARGCRHKNCANVAHLEPVTMRENMMRADTFQARNAAKTHCPADHEYDDINTYVYPNGRRSCRVCQRIRQRVAA